MRGRRTKRVGFGAGTEGERRGTAKARRGRADESTARRGRAASPVRQGRRRDRNAPVDGSRATQAARRGASRFSAVNVSELKRSSYPINGLLGWRASLRRRQWTVDAPLRPTGWAHATRNRRRRSGALHRKRPVGFFRCAEFPCRSFSLSARTLQAASARPPAASAGGGLGGGGLRRCP
jgi:hypothetical protein